MRIGNVIEAPGGGKWIVTDVDEDTVHAVSFDYENASAVQRMDDHERERACSECLDRDGGPSEDCEYCGGTMSVTVAVKGWKHSKVLAPSVKDFILAGIKRAWRL